MFALVWSQYFPHDQLGDHMTISHADHVYQISQLTEAELQD